MAKKRDGMRDISDAQTKAVTYTQKYLSTVALPFPSTMTDEEFKAAMDAIFKAIGSAYASGYLDGIATR